MKINEQSLEGVWIKSSPAGNFVNSVRISVGIMNGVECYIACQPASSKENDRPIDNKTMQNTTTEYRYFFFLYVFTSYLICI